MDFKNPWGKGSGPFDKWFSNSWNSESGMTKIGKASNDLLNTTDVLSTRVLTVANMPVPDPNWLLYIVKPGESFDSIATKFGTSGGGEDLAFWNNMDYSDPSLPTVGDALSLPYIDEGYLDDIENQLDDMTEDAEERGWTVAADNLKRFRAGTGGTKIMDVQWLKSFPAVQIAWASINEHFEDAFNDIADDMEDGQVINGDGRGQEPGNQFWWQGRIVPSFILSRDELSYACGGSTLTGVGVVTLSRKESITSVDGEVEFLFNDPYDWQAGQDVPIGVLARFRDSDMLLLEEYRGAKPFDMKASWKQSVSGTIDDDILSPNDVNLIWKDL